MTKHDERTLEAIERGAGEAFAVFVGVRDVSTLDRIECGVESAVRGWLDANTPALIEAVAERLAAKA